MITFYIYRGVLPKDVNTSRPGTWSPSWRIQPQQPISPSLSVTWLKQKQIGTQTRFLTQASDKISSTAQRSQLLASLSLTHSLGIDARSTLCSSLPRLIITYTLVRLMISSLPSSLLWKSYIVRIKPYNNEDTHRLQGSRSSFVAAFLLRGPDSGSTEHTRTQQKVQQAYARKAWGSETRRESHTFTTASCSYLSLVVRCTELGIILTLQIVPFVSEYSLYALISSPFTLQLWVIWHPLLASRDTALIYTYTHREKIKIKKFKY